MAALDPRERQLQYVSKQLTVLEKDVGLDPLPRLRHQPDASRIDRWKARCDRQIARAQRVLAHLKAVA